MKLLHDGRQWRHQIDPLKGDLQWLGRGLTRRSLLRPSHTRAVLADGSSAKIFGEVNLAVKLRHLEKEMKVEIAKITQDSILGLDAMKVWKAVIDVNNSVVKLDGYELSCIDGDCNALVAKVQVYKAIEIPPKQEVLLTGRLAIPIVGEAGLVQGRRTERANQVMVAACLVQPGGKRTVPLRFYNVVEHPVKLRSGMIIASYTAVPVSQVTAVSHYP